MNIKQIYKEKQKLIETVGAMAVNALYDDIENDDDYTLSTDENLELCEELLTMYLKGGLSTKYIKNK